MDVIASVAFATQVDSQNNVDDPFVRHSQMFFSFSFFRPVMLLFGQSNFFFYIFINYIGISYSNTTMRAEQMGLLSPVLEFNGEHVLELSGLPKFNLQENKA